MLSLLSVYHVQAIPSKCARGKTETKTNSILSKLMSHLEIEKLRIAHFLKKNKMAKCIAVE